MIDWLDPTLLVLGLAVGVGAFVQSSIGFGSAVVAAPFVVVLRPDLMPAALLLGTYLLPIVHLATGPREISWRPLGWAIGAWLLATPLGVLVVARTSTDVIAVTVGILILVTVAASLVAVELRATRGSALSAGAISGVSGTAASIGGPFFALILQHEPPARLRATLAVFFIAGTGIAMVSLLVAGEMTWPHVRAGLLWTPFVIAGHVLAGPVRSRLPAHAVRRGVLAFCVVASISVITRTVI